MTLDLALKIAKIEKYGYGIDLEDKSITVKESIEVLEKAVKNCWYVWITGENALEFLKEVEKIDFVA